MMQEVGRIEAIDRYAAVNMTKAQLVDELWHATYTLQQLQGTLRKERSRHDENVAAGRERLLAGTVAFDMLSDGVELDLRLYANRDEGRVA